MNRPRNRNPLHRDINQPPRQHISDLTQHEPQPSSPKSAFRSHQSGPSLRVGWRCLVSPGTARDRQARASGCTQGRAGRLGCTVHAPPPNPSLAPPSKRERSGIDEESYVFSFFVIFLIFITPTLPCPLSPFLNLFVECSAAACTWTGWAARDGCEVVRTPLPTEAEADGGWCAWRGYLVLHLSEGVYGVYLPCLTTCPPVSLYGRRVWGSPGSLPLV